MKKLVIIGGQGNGTVVASTVEDINRQRRAWDMLGFVNDGDLQSINGYPVIGGVNKSTIAPLLSDPDVYFYWSLISVRLNHKFIYRLRELEIPESRFATLIHPAATVSRYAKIGNGVSIQPFVNVGPNAELGNHIHVFAQAFIGHNARLDDFSYVANNACVGGYVHLKEGGYLGTNATTIERISIGKWAVVGMGSVVTRSVGDFVTVIGNPARVKSTMNEVTSG